jgi:hypothetical protein
MRRVPPGRHVFVARDPGASAGDESSLGSLDALPPANLHGYAEWDFSCVPDPVMFRCFLDATDYWFGCSNDSSTGSYDPARECYVVIANDPANATGAAGAGNGEVTPAPGIAPRLAAGPSTPAGADVDAQLAQARELEAKLAEEYRTVRLLRASMAGEASARGSWVNRPATASTPTSTSTTRTHLRGRARSSSPPRRCCGPCRPPRRLRHETCTARCRHSSSRRPFNRPRARRHASANRGTHEATRLRRGGEPSVHAGEATGRPANPGRTPAKERLLDTRRALDGDARNVINARRRAKRMRERRQATTHGGVDATTAMKTALRRRSPRGPVCSAGRSARRPSPSASASPRPLSSTTGRRIPACGSTITA